MESTVRSPQIGDDVIVILKMGSGRITELGGFIQEISSGYAYFGLDSLKRVRRSMLAQRRHHALSA
jgi:hypothetical protein